MPTIHTIGFTKRSAESFFTALQQAGVRRLIDVRLHNTSQLSGFAKRDDLAYFLGSIGDIDYRHEPLLTPTEGLLAGYRQNRARWPDYERGFRALLAERRAEQTLDRSLFDEPVVLLCSEATAERCHRRLVMEYLAEHWPSVTGSHL